MAQNGVLCGGYKHYMINYETNLAAISPENVQQEQQPRTQRVKRTK